MFSSVQVHILDLSEAHLKCISWTCDLTKQGLAKLAVEPIKMCNVIIAQTKMLGQIFEAYEEEFDQYDFFNDLFFCLFFRLNLWKAIMF